MGKGHFGKMHGKSEAYMDEGKGTVRIESLIEAMVFD